MTQLNHLQAFLGLVQMKLIQFSRNILRIYSIAPILGVESIGAIVVQGSVSEPVW